MNSIYNKPRRLTNDKDIEYYIQDDENTMLYKPMDMNFNKFFGTWSKLLTLNVTLNNEMHEKYIWDYQAHFKAKMEVGSAPICFDKCINDVTSSAGLNSDEKNCMRECYMKRVGSKDDFNMLTTQLLARENQKSQKQNFV